MRAAVLAATVACVMATGVQAAVVTVTAPVGQFAPDTGEAFDQVPAFNAALGTLTGVTISTVATLSERFSTIPLNNVPAPTSGTFASVFKASIFGGTTFPATSQTVTIGLPGTASVFVSNSFTTSPASYFSDGGPVFVEYSGYFTPVSGVSQSNISSTFISGSGTVSVAYDYTPAGTAVPEPVSMSLLGAGLLGLAIARRQPAI